MAQARSRNLSLCRVNLPTKDEAPISAAFNFTQVRHLRSVALRCAAFASLRQADSPNCCGDGQDAACVCHLEPRPKPIRQRRLTAASNHVGFHAPAHEPHAGLRKALFRMGKPYVFVVCRRRAATSFFHTFLPAATLFSALVSSSATPRALPSPPSQPMRTLRRDDDSQIWPKGRVKNRRAIAPKQRCKQGTGTNAGPSQNYPIQAFALAPSPRGYVLYRTEVKSKSVREARVKPCPAPVSP